MAIYRYVASRGITTPVALKSIIWEMTECFIGFIKDEEHRTSMRQRIELLKKESKSCSDRINAFLTEISWTNMSFEALKYNDVVEEIQESRFVDDFCKRYFFTDATK